MDSADSIDWLQQQDREAWKTLIRQLRHELRQEREQGQTKRPTTQDVGLIPRIRETG